MTEDEQRTEIVRVLLGLQIMTNAVVMRVCPEMLSSEAYVAMNLALERLLKETPVAPCEIFGGSAKDTRSACGRR